MNRSTVLSAYVGMHMMGEAAVMDAPVAAAPAPVSADANVAAQAAAKPAPIPVPAGHFGANFHFRTEKIRNEKQEVIGEGKKNPDVSVHLPEPSDEDLINYIATGGKEKDFLKNVVREAIKAAARVQINTFREENPEAIVTPSVLDLSKLTFAHVATLDAPAPEIAEEVWTSFYDDYKAVLVALGTAPERIQKHIVLFKSQFRTCRYDKPALGVLNDRLNLWAAKTENMDDNAECFKVLHDKLEKYMKAEEKNLVAAL